MRPRDISAFGRFLALLALTGQLVLGAAITRFDPLAALIDLTTICNGHEASDKAPPAPHSPAGCLICPLCVSLSTPALAILTPLSGPAPPGIAVARGAVSPPATAPPTTVLFAARPRGPPAILT
jgi:hypothetical protein